LIVALVVGLLGAITGEAKYERQSRIRSERFLQTEREVKEFFFGRDFSAEIASRGFRFIIGAAIGVLVAVLALAVFARSRSIIATLSSVGRSATLSIGHVRSSVTIGEGDAVLTTGSVSSPPPQTGASKSQRRAVFDVRFNKFVTPVILSFFYVICLVAACLAGFVFWLQTISDFSEDGLGSGFIAFLWTTPLMLLAVILVCLLVRLIFESVMVIFRIAEDLRRIRDK
jgi:hypothetical protein